MLASELRGKDKEALHSELVGLQKELFNIRFQRVSEQLKNTSRIRVIRHDIARIKTVSSEMARSPEPKSAKPVKRKK
ncbi:MAG: 50S ribosomal protein L29 [Alphaproteobacteria bacterium 16-39-46]|nr:MAG: 50S ribosomal protein L29 [Alphaproteobacteria bacterium 16-39-46]OZA42918.1 MAG: 50S ribosomal protein L29 [Alphaproteobacteria bacterium 17-39-52]